MKKSAFFNVMIAACISAIAFPMLSADQPKTQVIPKTIEEATEALVGSNNNDAAASVVGRTYKAWTWAPTSINGGAVWGNGGYKGRDITEPGEILNCTWWGCGTEDGPCSWNNKFRSQLQHSASGQLTGDEYTNSYMVFGDDGTLKKYNQWGDLLNVGEFKVADWFNGQHKDCKMGDLDTSAGAILWPYQINNNGYMPTQFEIAYLSYTDLILIYGWPGGGAWSECTWWSFKAIEEDTGSVNNPTVDKGIQVSSSDGVLYINSDKAQTINIYDTNGRLLKKVKVREGKNAVRGLNKGIYVVNATKVKLK